MTSTKGKYSVRVYDRNGVLRLTITDTDGSVNLALYPRDPHDHGGENDTEPILRLFGTGQRERRAIRPVEEANRLISWAKYNMDREQVPDLYQLARAVLAGEADPALVLDWLAEHGPGVVHPHFLERLTAALGVA